MIFPVSSQPAPLLNRVSTRSFQGDGETARPERVLPVPALAPITARRRRFPGTSFSAQLLALGLRYGMEDLITKADGQHAIPIAEGAARSYEIAQDNFAHEARPALFARWSA